MILTEKRFLIATTNKSYSEQINGRDRLATDKTHANIILSEAYKPDILICYPIKMHKHILIWQ